MKYFNAEAVDWTFERTVGVSNDKLVLLAIARRANKHWAAFPSKAEIARITGLSEASLPRSFKRLEDEGHMVRIAFAAGNRQEQKIGFVLAGCGRPLDALDADFLALAFASRKQSGTPMAAKPQHWSGERIGEGRTAATPQGRTGATPGGCTAATPRRKEQEEDQKEQEDGAIAQARDRSRPPSNPPAIAEVAAIAEAPAGAGVPTNGESAGKAGEEARRGNTRQRDDNWRAQLEAADLDDLHDALAAYHDARCGLEEWAYRTAASDLGIDFGADGEIPEAPDGSWTRLTYLYLLKKHDSDPGDWEIQSALLEPLDSSIQAPERPYQVVHKLPPPNGVSPREFADQMKAVVTLMEPTEIGPYIAEFREARRGVWWESLGKAEELLRERKQKVTAQAKNYAALHVAIDRYVKRGTWEMELVPPSMRPQRWQSAGEAPPWAA